MKERNCQILNKRFVAGSAHISSEYASIDYCYTVVNQEGEIYHITTTFKQVAQTGKCFYRFKYGCLGWCWHPGFFGSINDFIEAIGRKVVEYQGVRDKDEE